ncbi:PREDICTED: uncharacterized protein LOC105556041 [Vollenhovia emeryi]|uniref:uncharacterized protein LOC105556041 n=1 Tax=Vollenhovia emeryi TaxID=411798 RepID=UPI0005F3EB15|nr:PREDICTED: uncharacterized protein LOC105556041 [Vollenhovia emeryi]
MLQGSKATRRQYRLWLRDPIPKPPKSTAYRYKLQENECDQVQCTVASQDNYLLEECTEIVTACNLDPVNNSFNTVCDKNDETDTVLTLSSLCSDSVSDEVCINVVC